MAKAALQEVIVPSRTGRTLVYSDSSRSSYRTALCALLSLGEEHYPRRVRSLGLCCLQARRATDGSNAHS
jgi:hypothetical protein